MDILPIDYRIYTINNESDVSNILDHFTPEYMYDIVNNTIELNKSNSPMAYSIPNPNIVASFDSNFKYLLDREPEEEDRINALKVEVYTKLLEFLCIKFNLSLNTESLLDYFSLALHLYDFLISNFNIYLINFFCDFVYTERYQIFAAMNFEEVRKSKDSATIYGKKIFSNDPKLGVIIANLAMVLENIVCFDFSFDNIVSHVCGPQIGKFLSTHVIPNGNFFKEIYVQAFQNPFAKPIIITNIRLMLQQKFKDTLDYGKGEF